MRSEWEARPLSSATRLIAAPKSIRSREVRPTGDFPVVSQEAGLICGYWDDPDALLRVDAPLILFGDHNRVVKYVDFDFVVGAQGLKILKADPDLNPRFLYHQMCSWALESLGYSRHWRLVKDRSVVIPPLAEQERVVRLLDSTLSAVEEARAKSNRIADLTESLIQSRLDEIFGGVLPTGWRRYRMPEVAQNRDSQRIPVTRAKRKPGPFPYYGASGVVDWVDHYIFDGDALLVAEDGANLVNRASPVAFSVSGRYWVNNHAHVLRFRHGATQTLVENWFASVSLVEFLTGTAQPKLNQGALNSLEVPLPTALEERESLAEGIIELRMQAGEASRIQADKELSLDELRRSILHHAFTGQL